MVLDLQIWNFLEMLVYFSDFELACALVLDLIFFLGLSLALVELIVTRFSYLLSVIMVRHFSRN